MNGSEWTILFNWMITRGSPILGIFRLFFFLVPSVFIEFPFKDPIDPMVFLLDMTDPRS